MNYKILCSDLDGTLLSTKSDVSDFTISEINRIKKTTRIILVSARMPKAMTYLQGRLGIGNEPIICYNGALIIDNNVELSSTTIDLPLVENIQYLAEEHSIKLGLYSKDEWYVEEYSERIGKEINYTRTKPVFRRTMDTLADWHKRNIGAHKIMLMGTMKSINEVLPKLEDKFGSLLNIYRSNDTLIEITPKSVSKLSAIKSLLDNDTTLNDVIAFGDNYNDAEMLQHVHCGVAVANGREEVKTISNHITLKNTDDGVAHFLNLHFNI